MTTKETVHRSAHEKERRVTGFAPPASPKRIFTPRKEARQAILPGAALLGLKARSVLELERDLERGLSVTVIGILKHAVRGTSGEIAPLLGVSESTINRRLSPKAQGRLDPRESERAYRLARLLARATEVMGSAEDAQAWLHEPLLAIGNRTPLEVARSEPGAELVLQVLGRLEDGVYS